MSLRIRLNLLITFLFVIALVGGSIYIISGTQQKIEDEMRSTTELTSKLVELLWESLQVSQDAGMQRRFIDGLQRLDTSRHVQIMVTVQGGSNTQAYENKKPFKSDVPDWFASLVVPPSVEYHHAFMGQDIPVLEVHIRADPSDELSEVWSETKDALVLLFLYVFTANVLIYLILGRDLQPIESILSGLNRIEKGDYALRLPEFSLPELNRISEKFNHVAAVLQRSKQENRYLVQQTLAIQEQERRHLAQELHDELGQSLSAVKAVAVSIQQDSDKAGRVKQDNAELIISFTDRMYDVAHSMMQRLRPSVLDQLGLVTAVEELIDGWNTRHGESFCRFSSSGELNNLSDNLNINLYRIVQEGLTNVSKYARANEVSIALCRTKTENEDVLSIEIVDDGVGFDSLRENKGLGILGIRERVDALGGSFALRTGPGEGVQINIDIPISRHVENKESILDS